MHDKRWSLVNTNDDNWVARFEKLRPLPVVQAEEEILTWEAELSEGSRRVQ
jgi:hypothetical protein